MILEPDAEEAGSVDTYVHIFDKPFTFEGETFESLSFDFGALTAADSLAVERELADMGRRELAPETAGAYQIRLAARACTTRRADGRRLGVDAYMAMPIAAYTRIRGRVRSFLLLAGL